jgi:regulator of protease activity HflC (stomatin/prohibitin superfamily)
MNFNKLGISPSKVIKYFLGSVVTPYVLYHCLYKVEPGFLAIKFDVLQGVLPKVHREGYHLLLPFIQRPIIYDCRMKNHVFVSVVGTKDLQIVQLKTRLISRPDSEHLPELYRLLGLNFEERVLYSIVYEICGSVISQYNASQLINQRDTISYLVKQKLQEKAKEFYIELDDVALVIYKFTNLLNFNFS